MNQSIQIQSHACDRNDKDKKNFIFGSKKISWSYKEARNVLIIKKGIWTVKNRLLH